MGDWFLRPERMQEKICRRDTSLIEEAAAQHALSPHRLVLARTTVLTEKNTAKKQPLHQRDRLRQNQGPGWAPQGVSALCLNTTPHHPQPTSELQQPAGPAVVPGSPRENTTSLGSQVPLGGHTRQGIQGLRLREPWKGGASGFRTWGV